MSAYVRLSFLPLMVLCASLGIANQPVTIKDSVLGGFDFNKPLITNAQLVRLFGEGCVDKNFPYFYRRMYYFPRQDTYAAFKIETDDFVVGLRLTKETVTSKQCKATRQLRSFSTGEGILLGDSEQKLIKAYGPPFKRETKGNDIIL